MLGHSTGLTIENCQIVPISDTMKWRDNGLLAQDVHIIRDQRERRLPVCFGKCVRFVFAEKHLESFHVTLDL